MPKIEEIPKAFRYNCDGCGRFHTQENANGHYTNSTPPYWATIKIKFHKREEVEKLFCDECSDPLVSMIQNWKGRK